MSEEKIILNKIFRENPKLKLKYKKDLKNYNAIIKGLNDKELMKELTTNI